MNHELLHISDEVQQALHHQQPIVVLETPAISLWSSVCDSLDITLTIADIIREHGVLPVHIALHQGKIHVGLAPKMLEMLCHQKDIPRASRRDIPYFLSKQLSANTNVSATLFCAHLAKLPIFITGGLGGIHHHIHDGIATLDLLDLSSIPITVVCSGAQSILDLPKALDTLETQGASLVGYQTDEFPAFFNHTSGIALPHRLDTPAEIARLMVYQKQLHTNNTLIIANPIPKSAEIPDEDMLPVIKQAQQEQENIHGKSITPCLLDRISELTAAQNVQAYTELLKHNAKLGTQIAIHYQKHINQDNNRTRDTE